MYVKQDTVVAVENHEIVGFGDMDGSGYLDCLFVHQVHQRQGIATAICDALERSVNGKQITAHASITAKDFFLRRGHRIARKQEVVRCGVSLTNFLTE